MWINLIFKFTDLIKSLNLHFSDDVIDPFHTNYSLNSFYEFFSVYLQYFVYALCFSVFAVKDIMIEKTENDDVNDFQPLAEHSKALFY